MNHHTGNQPGSTGFDLKTHQNASRQDLSYLDQESGERFIPYVVEPAAGVDRGALVFLLDAYTEDEAPDAKGKMEKRTVLRLDRRLVPVKVLAGHLGVATAAAEAGPNDRASMRHHGSPGSYISGWNN